MNREKTFQFMGTVYKYTNKNSLYKIFTGIGMRPTQAKQFVDKIISGQDSGVRYAIDELGHFEIINIKKDFRHILKEQFEIHRVNRKKIVKGEPIKDIEILPQLGPLDQRNSTFRIKYYVTFYNYTLDSILDEENSEILANIQRLAIRQYGDNAVGYRKMDEATDIALANGTLKIDNARFDALLEEGLILEREKMYGNIMSTSIADNSIVRNLKQRYNYGLAPSGHVVVYKYDVLTTFREKVYKRSDYMIGLEEYDLRSIYSNIAYIGQTHNDINSDSCCVRFINDKFPELYWEIRKIQNKNPNGCVGYGQFETFLTNNNIPFEFKDVSGKILSSSNNKKLHKFNQNQVVRAIIYDNHIYPYEGGKLIKISKTPMKEKKVDNCLKMLYTLWNKDKKIPRNIKLDSNKESIYKDQGKIICSSFISGTTRYFQNCKYDRCKEILSKLGIDIKIPVDINFQKVIDIYIKYRKSGSCVKSFLPNSNICKLGAIQYENKDIDIESKNIVTIDLSKAYPFAFSELKFLARHDWRIHDVIDCSKIDCKETLDYYGEHYFYYVVPECYTFLIPQTGIYPGYHLKYAMLYDIKFELLEVYETETCNNFYSEIILKTYDIMTEQEFKDTWVRIIGMQEQSYSKRTSMKFDKITSEKEAGYFEGNSFKYKSSVVFIENKERITNIRNLMFINYQIKCAIYKIVFDKLQELKITADNLVNINTDSISYIGKLPKQLSREFGKWKQVDFKPYEAFRNREDKGNLSVPSLQFTITNGFPQNRVLYNKYAGSGKTYTIINSLINDIIKQGKTYIVLTPTHSTQDDYKNVRTILGHKINVNTIQHYVNKHIIPVEEVIIIDEIGMSDAKINDFLFELLLIGKSYYCFGDYKQLLLPGEKRPYNKEHYLKFMFTDIYTDYLNFRNNFTTKYYDDLYNMKLNLKNEVHRWGKPRWCELNFNNEEYVLCYRNEIIDKYNETILKYLKLEEYSVGTKVICMDNTALSDYGIWKNKMFKITNRDKSLITLTDKHNKQFKIPIKKIKYFKHSYCVNVYAIQGKTITNYHWAHEDDWVFTLKDCNMAGRCAYTSISRIKRFNKDLENKIVEYNNKQSIVNNIDINKEIKYHLRRLELLDSANNICNI